MNADSADTAIAALRIYRIYHSAIAFWLRFYPTFAKTVQKKRKMVRKHFDAKTAPAPSGKKAVKGLKKPAEVEKKTEGAVAKKKPASAATRLRKFNRVVKTAQKASHEKHQFNRTQFRRLVAEIMKEYADGYRISNLALDPLLEIVESSLHKTFVLSRSMSFDVSGKRSINIRSFNLAEAALLRPGLFEAGPSLVAASFDDHEKGIQSQKQTFTGEPPAKRVVKKKSDAPEGAAAEEEEGEEEEDAE